MQSSEDLSRSPAWEQASLLHPIAAALGPDRSPVSKCSPLDSLEPLQFVPFWVRVLVLPWVRVLVLP